MQAERLKILYDLVKEEPHDPFNKYALALEFKKMDMAKAQLAFEELLSTHPDYLATYYQLGEVLVSQEKYKESLPIYEKGIKLAQQLSNSKTEKELRGALQIAKDELEEW